MSREGRSAVVGRLSGTHAGHDVGRLLAVLSLGVPRAPTIGRDASGASFDRVGYEPELPAWLCDVIETLAADGSETSGKQGSGTIVSHKNSVLCGLRRPLSSLRFIPSGTRGTSWPL